MKLWRCFHVEIELYLKVDSTEVGQTHNPGSSINDQMEWKPRKDKRVLKG